MSFNLKRQSEVVHKGCKPFQKNAIAQDWSDLEIAYFYVIY